jgi:hypothetical protein
MMDIATFKNAIKAWVEVQAGISAQWRDEQGGWQGKTRARLHLHSSRSVGVDFLYHEQDQSLPAGEDYVPTVMGNREITLSIKVESRDQDGNGVAIWYLEKLRTSLRKPSVRAGLYEAGLSFSTVETPQDLDKWLDDRIESVAVMDVHFNAAVNERDADEATSFVETTEIGSTLTDPAGNDVGWDPESFPQ